MKTMKEATPQETEAIRRRARRSLAMGRITEESCDKIVFHLDAIDAEVATMYETIREEYDAR